MSDPAYAEPDERGLYHLRVGGEVKTFSIESDDRGYFLVEVLAWETLPEHIRLQVEKSRVRPDQLVTMSLDELED